MLKFIASILLMSVSLALADTSAPSPSSSATKNTAKPSKNIFTGSWKANDGAMLISFFGADSLRVSDSKGQKKTESSGTFVKTDSTFTANLNNNDIILTMTFKYKIKDKKTVSAMIAQFLVDGEKTEAPKKWMTMTRIPVTKSAESTTATPASIAK